MRSGSVARGTSSVEGVVTIQACLNVPSVGEKTFAHFLSKRIMVIFPFRGRWSDGSRNRAMEALAVKLSI